MQRLALFARHPLPGKVKTRLSPALPPNLACDLYRGLLADTLELLRSSHADELWLYWAEQIADAQAGSSIAGPEVAEAVQRGADLGERLSSAFDALLSAPGDRAMIFGADCPWLQPGMVSHALSLLRSFDVVIGPARDGGYTLIGLARAAPTLFDGIEWGSDRVLTQTLERARAAGLQVVQLEPLEDLDTPEDLVRVLARLVEQPAAAPHTRRALEAMGLLPRADAISSRPPGAAAG